MSKKRKAKKSKMAKKRANKPVLDKQVVVRDFINKETQPREKQPEPTPVVPSSPAIEKPRRWPEPPLPEMYPSTDTVTTASKIRRRALFNLFVTPVSVISSTAGATTMLLSWAFGGGGWMTFLGLISILIGVGFGLTNFVFNIEPVINEAAKQVEKEVEAVGRRQLDKLDANLCLDLDPRDQEYLREVRHLYDNFVKDHKDGKLSGFITDKTMADVKELFDAIVKKLELAHGIWEQSTRMSGRVKEVAERERNEMIEEVGQAVTHMSEIIGNIRLLSVKNNTGELDKLRANLDRSLEVARRTHERMYGIDEELRELQ